MLINAAGLDTRPPEEVVKGMVPRVGAGIAWGPSYWGKSLLLGGELALSVANGEPFLGREVIRGSVALCLGEGLYDAGVRKQARIIRQRRDNAAHAAALAEIEDDPDAGAEWLAGQPPYTDDRLFIETEAFPLPVGRDGGISPGMRQALDGLAQIPDLELVILDALPDFTGGASLSHDASASRIMLGMHAIVKELSCCVLAISHPTARGDKMIGAQRLFNSADFVYQVQPVHGSPGSGSPMVAALACEKNKYGSPFAPVQYVIEPIEWDEPATDEAGNRLDGEPDVTIRSATVRLHQPKSAKVLRLPSAELPGQPENQPGLRLAAPPKRTGLRTSARPAAARGGAVFALQGI
jgi:AAA domain